MIRILQFGATGQVARCVLAAAEGRVRVTALSRADCDLSDSAAIEAAIAAADCDLVLNCAAFTAVDAAESDPQAAMAVNVDAPAAMARACAARGLPLIHLSTDYVFDGAKGAPYVETDPATPLASVYAQSKLTGEAAVLAYAKGVVFRIAWVFSPLGRNFVTVMMRLARERDEVRIVADQTSTPTSAVDLADFLVRTAPRWAAAAEGDTAFGLFHFANAGVATRFELASGAIARDPQARAGLTPVPMTAFPEPAPRPAYSALDTTKLSRVFGEHPRPWREAVAETADALVANGALNS
jgi:dTDP-4-dehydrorhamnose reductase